MLAVEVTGKEGSRNYVSANVRYSHETNVVVLSSRNKVVNIISDANITKDGGIVNVSGKDWKNKSPLSMSIRWATEEEEKIAQNRRSPRNR
jgi:hypothetical protein